MQDFQVRVWQPSHIPEVEAIDFVEVKYRDYRLASFAAKLSTEELINVLKNKLKEYYERLS